MEDFFFFHILGGKQLSILAKRKDKLYNLFQCCGQYREKREHQWSSMDIDLGKAFFCKDKNFYREFCKRSNYLSPKIVFYCCWYCSVVQSCLTFCDLMDCSTPGFPVLLYLPEFAQSHVLWVDHAIQLSHLLFHPSPPALNLPQHHDVFQWVSFLHQVATESELWLQHQYLQWVFTVDFL